AFRPLLKDVAGAQLLLEERRSQTVKPDGGQEPLQDRQTFLRVVLHPADDGLEHLGLALDVQLVLLDQRQHLARTQHQELVRENHLESETSRVIVLTAAVLAGKVCDADAVAGVKLVLQEHGASLHHVVHLEHGGCRQQVAHVGLLYAHLRTYLSGVGKLHELGQRAGRDPVQRNDRHLLLAHARREHGAEVGAGRRQHDLVRLDALLASHQRHVAELARAAQHAHHLQRLARVPHDREVHRPVRRLLRDLRPRA
ncbi:hypothetical protein EGW08_014589, partial [Elysia chlorotica]